MYMFVYHSFYKYVIWPKLLGSTTPHPLDNAGLYWINACWCPVGVAWRRYLENVQMLSYLDQLTDKQNTALAGAKRNRNTYTLMCKKSMKSYQRYCHIIINLKMFACKTLVFRRIDQRTISINFRVTDRGKIVPRQDDSFTLVNHI